ncbi:MAG: aminotransferase class III-fold pyridoxal phosphate-dependent enzyme, partial [Planctomycetota bacterium]|nr:aminotransferase class III-fold pyridoxal phosphate-dependent enzyme [Planctomycetota bacterium]
FIALEGAYHGDTVGAMSASEPAPFFEELSPFLFHVVRVKPNPEELAEAFQELEGRVAAFICEPLVQGAAGMKMYGSSFLKEAQGLCQKNGAFLIADEVLTGFGRTGTTFACEQAGISPDFLCLSKGLTGGTMPLAATLCTESIFQSFVSNERARAFFHGHTYTANPIGCAVALESLRILREENTPQKLNHIGERIETGLADLRENPLVKDLRRRGGIVALELQSENSGYMAELGNRLRAACQELDSVLLRPLGNVLYAMPPSCTTDDECALIVKAIKQIVVPMA